jgi:hypothetical protein
VLAASAPDPGSVTFAATCAMVFSFFGAAYGFSRQEPKDDIQWKAFVGTVVGIGLGLLVWGFGLLSGLY